MQWALSAVVRGNGLAESTVAGWLTHSDAILVIGKVSYSWADENLQILSSNPAILVEISTRITEFSERIQ